MEQMVTNRVTGEQITFIKTAKDTKGEYLIIEVALPPSAKVPHYIFMTALKRSLK